MKQSKSRLARKAQLAEKRASGKPKVSKYAAKTGRGQGGVEFQEAWLDEFGPTVEDLAAKYSHTHKDRP
jgi:hypothetical protein